VLRQEGEKEHTINVVLLIDSTDKKTLVGQGTATPCRAVRPDGKELRLDGLIDAMSGEARFSQEEVLNILAFLVRHDLLGRVGSMDRQGSILTTGPGHVLWLNLICDGVAVVMERAAWAELVVLLPAVAMHAPGGPGEPAISGTSHFKIKVVVESKGSETAHQQDWHCDMVDVQGTFRKICILDVDVSSEKLASLEAEWEPGLARLNGENCSVRDHISTFSGMHRMKAKVQQIVDQVIASPAPPRCTAVGSDARPRLTALGDATTTTPGPRGGSHSSGVVHHSHRRLSCWDWAPDGKVGVRYRDLLSGRTEPCGGRSFLDTWCPAR